MKKLLLIMVLMFSVIFAGKFNISKEHPKFEQIEENLIHNISSENTGVLYTSILMLGDIKSENSVNKLARILRGEYPQEIKIASALSLAKIGTTYSKYIIKRVTDLTEDKKIAELLNKFYAAAK